MKYIFLTVFSLTFNHLVLATFPSQSQLDPPSAQSQTADLLTSIVMSPMGMSPALDTVDFATPAVSAKARLRKRNLDFVDFEVVGVSMFSGRVTFPSRITPSVGVNEMVLLNPAPKHRRSSLRASSP